MDYKERAQEWIAKAADPALKAELAAIAGDDNELKERFVNEMSFGTAGIRGKMGVGVSRMNIYTVRRVTQGLADHINGVYGGGSVAVSYDTRHNSELFAHETAEVLAANGIGVAIYPTAEPTPMLSFAVRQLGCTMGVMITASHNPAAYNGYKVFDGNGCQITESDADLILRCIERLDYFDGIRHQPIDWQNVPAEVLVIGRRVVEEYHCAVLAACVETKPALLEKLKVAYTPLHGTGYRHVTALLEQTGVRQLHIVEEQREPDGDFTTCEYPNPETAAALERGIALMLEQQCDILLATDPDADRIGVAVRQGNEARILTGNDIGALLLDYIIRARQADGTLPTRPVAVRSMVSTALADRIAEKAGVELRCVLTGFKYIGEQIHLLEQAGEQERFIFGFEESCGYLSGEYVRDKDAQNAAVLIAGMAAACKKQGRTLADALEELYRTFGYYKTRTISFSFEGLSGARVMADKMAGFRRQAPAQLAGRAIVGTADYQTGIRRSAALGTETSIGLPKSDIIEWDLAGGGRVIVRPSGTEPKIKVYLMAAEPSEEQSKALIDALEKELTGEMA